MRKTFIIIAVLALGLSMTGCGIQSLNSTMQIAPAELTEQESQIVQLIRNGSSSTIFDYAVNSEIKSVSALCYKLDENGKWVASSGCGSFPLQNSTGRIAISFNNLYDGMRVAVQEGDSINASEINTGEKIDSKYQGSATSFASTESIECEKEIPLAIQVFTSKNEIASCGVEFFNKPEEYQNRGYEDVYVLVIKFSKDELI